MENNNNNNNAVGSSSANNASATAVISRGRKYGLIGGGQTQQQQQQQQQSSTDANVHHTMMTVTQLMEAGRKLSVRETDQRNSWMYALSDSEMEDKYNAICLSLRTESLTITQRLEHSTAERDLVENNLNKEMQVLHSLFLMLKQEVGRSQSKQFDGISSSSSSINSINSSGCCYHEVFSRLANQVDAVHNLAMRSLPRAAESLGAVEYESRLSAAIQILILYVDQVKRKWEREHNELEELKRVLKESGVNVAQCLSTLPGIGGSSGGSGGGGGRTGGGSLVGDSLLTTSSSSSPANKRRASFPAAPLRRISLRSPPPVPYASSARGANLLLLEPAKAAAAAAAAAAATAGEGIRRVNDEKQQQQQVATISHSFPSPSLQSVDAVVRGMTRHRDGDALPGAGSSSGHHSAVLVVSSAVQPIAEERDDEDVESLASINVAVIVDDKSPSSLTVAEVKTTAVAETTTTAVEVAVNPSVVQQEGHVDISNQTVPQPSSPSSSSSSPENAKVESISEPGPAAPAAAANSSSSINTNTNGAGRRRSSSNSNRPAPAVTIRRRGGVSGTISGKSHSWSSGSGRNMLDIHPDYAIEQDAIVIAANSKSNNSSLSKLVAGGGGSSGGVRGTKGSPGLVLRCRQWATDQVDSILSSLDVGEIDWNYLEQNKLFILRILASFCLALAAICSLIFTFVPATSSSSQSPTGHQHQPAVVEQAAAAAAAAADFVSLNSSAAIG